MTELVHVGVTVDDVYERCRHVVHCRRREVNDLVRQVERRVNRHALTLDLKLSENIDDTYMSYSLASKGSSHNSQQIRRCFGTCL